MEELVTDQFRDPVSLPISRFMAAALKRHSGLDGEEAELLQRIVADLTAALQQGHICIELNDEERQVMSCSALVGDASRAPLVLSGKRLYFGRYFGYEWEVTDEFRSGYNQLRLAQGPIFPLFGSPEGNRENTDVSLALSYFEKALHETSDPELAARAAFMAARCRQKQWFCSPDCNYQPDSKLIPVIPEDYAEYYNLLLTKYSGTKFFNGIIKECKWLAAYAR